MRSWVPSHHRGYYFGGYVWMDHKYNYKCYSGSDVGWYVMDTMGYGLSIEIYYFIN